MEYAGYGIVSIIYIVLVVWAVIDLLSTRRSGCTTLLWLLLIIIVPVLGSILYLLLGRHKTV